MRRVTALIAVLLFALFAGVFAYGMAGGEDAPVNATVSEFDPDVSVSDVDYENATGDGVSACLTAGPPQGHYGLAGDVGVRRPIGSGDGGDETFHVAVALGSDSPVTARNVTLETGESERVDLFEVAPTDGTVAAGETMTARARVTHEGEPVANATRSVEVRAIDYVDCETGE